MEKDKQIEEMAKAIYNLDHCEGYKDDRGCMYAPTCSVCKYGRENKAKQISELLTKQGYRKASDVARELSDHIEFAVELVIDTIISEIRKHRKVYDLDPVWLPTEDWLKETFNDLYKKFEKIFKQEDSKC